MARFAAHNAANLVSNRRRCNCGGRFWSRRPIRRPPIGDAQRVLSLTRRHSFRQRFDYCGFIICSVRDFTFTFNLGTSERVPFYGIDCHSACSDFLWRIFANRTPRCRSPNWVVAFYLLAFWVRRNLIRLRTAQGRKTCKGHFRGDDATCDWLERRDRARLGVRSYMARH